MRPADNGTLQCIGIRDLVINQHLTLKDVLHCPTISMKLLSTVQLNEQCFKIQDSENEIHILRDRKFILRARQSGGVYFLSLTKL